MAIIESNVPFNHERRTWNIQIDSPIGQIPQVILQRETCWLKSSNPTESIVVTKDDLPTVIPGTDSSLNISVNDLCALLGLDINVHSVAILIGALGDFYDPVINPPAPPAEEPTP